MSQNSQQPKNQILAALPVSEYQRLANYLQPVSLKAGTILHEVGHIIREVYFPLEGMISLVAILANGSTTEIGIIGRQGMAGLPVIFGGNSTNIRSVVQITGSALKLSAEIVKQEFDRQEQLYRFLLLYIQAIFSLVSQNAVCNNQHTIEQRLARWLLIVSDCLEEDRLPLTQEFIGNMLGIRRAGVSVTANSLQKKGIIEYHRGQIKILDRAKLEANACECYRVLKDEWSRVLIYR